MKINPDLLTRIANNNGSITRREQRILSLRAGIYDGKERTRGEVGAEMGISGERVRQIEKKAIEKLEYPLL